MDNEIRQLILNAQSGNAEAFHELVALHDERIMILAYKLTRNELDAEDLYQEVFLKVYKRIKQFRFESEFYTWLYRITVNTAYNQNRKNSKLRVQDQVTEDGFDPLNWIQNPDSHRDDYREVMSAVKNSLETLPRQQRTVFILKHLEQLKIKDISSILNIAEGTVKRYLFRAMEKLRQELKEYQYA